MNRKVEIWAQTYLVYSARMYLFVKIIAVRLKKRMINEFLWSTLFDCLVAQADLSIRLPHNMYIYWLMAQIIDNERYCLLAMYFNGNMFGTDTLYKYRHSKQRQKSL